jgi:hypothetical protein
VTGSLCRALRVLCAGCAASAVTALAFAGSADASTLGAGSCTTGTLSQPFAQFGDNSSYELAPGGDFEGTLSGWTLSGGASQVAGSETFGATGTVGSYSLGLPAGSSATSPQICVDPQTPTFRFFDMGSTPGSVVTVKVVYQVPWGTATIPVGVIAPGASWAPSPRMLTGSLLAGLLNGGTANMAIEFVASGGTAQIDDLFVDPWGKG